MLVGFSLGYQVLIKGGGYLDGVFFIKASDDFRRGEMGVGQVEIMEVYQVYRYLGKWV